MFENICGIVVDNESTVILFIDFLCSKFYNNFFFMDWVKQNCLRINNSLVKHLSVVYTRVLLHNLLKTLTCFYLNNFRRSTLLLTTTYIIIIFNQYPVKTIKLAKVEWNSDSSCKVGANMSVVKVFRTSSSYFLIVLLSHLRCSTWVDWWRCVDWDRMREHRWSEKFATVEHLVGGGGAGSLLPGASPAQHPPNMLQPMEEMILPPKRQAVVDRLRWVTLGLFIRRTKHSLCWSQK